MDAKTKILEDLLAHPDAETVQAELITATSAAEELDFEQCFELIKTLPPHLIEKLLNRL